MASKRLLFNRRGSALRGLLISVPQEARLSSSQLGCRVEPSFPVLGRQTLKQV